MYTCIYAVYYFQGLVKGQDVLIRTDHATLKWLLSFKGSDAMYHRWIAEMQSYMPYKLEARSGSEHRNADGMSKAKKHCKFDECESYRFHHERNDKEQDSDSVDSGPDEQKSPVQLVI